MRNLFLTLLLAFSTQMAWGQAFVHLYTYKSANEVLAPRTKHTPRTILIGDSITEVWAKTCPDFFADGKRVGRGISGEVSAQMLLRFRSDVIDNEATAVVICAGTNDIALNQGDYNEDYTFGNIVTMVELAKVHGIKPILASVLPATGFRWRPEVKDAPEKILALNARLKAYAKAHKLVYLDYYSAMVSDDGISLNPAYTYDGVHPSKEGCKAMEQVYLKMLKK